VNGVEQRPIEGVSMVYTFDAQPDDESKRETQYFEMVRAEPGFGWVWSVGVAVCGGAGLVWVCLLSVLCAACVSLGSQCRECFANSNPHTK
jgi:hypothetical protein